MERLPAVLAVKTGNSVSKMTKGQATTRPCEAKCGSLALLKVRINLPKWLLPPLKNG